MLPLFSIFTLFDRGRLAASFVFSILMLFDQGSRTVRMRDVPCRVLRHMCGTACDMDAWSVESEARGRAGRIPNLVRLTGAGRLSAMNGCLRIVVHGGNCSQKKTRPKGRVFKMKHNVRHEGASGVRTWRFPLGRLRRCCRFRFQNYRNYRCHSRSRCRCLTRGPWIP